MNPNPTAPISYEISKLEAIAGTYPPSIREDFVWFGRYVDEVWKRELGAVEARLKHLGSDTTRDTLSKILRGRMFLDSQGRTLPHPIMSLRNFNAMVDKLRTDSQNAATTGRIPFVKTPTYEKIANYIDDRRAPDRVCKFGLIIGPTGAQKTASFRQYSMENNHGVCVTIQASQNGRLARFITDLASAYGCASHHKSATKQLRITECVTAKRCIIVDNIQYLYEEREDIDRQPVFNFLQKLQDDTGCTVILSATPTFESKFTAGRAKGYFEQFIGRCGGDHEFLLLPPNAPMEDVLQIAEAFGLKNIGKKDGEFLEQISQRPGRIRILFQALQIAKNEADANEEPITVDHVRAQFEKEKA